MDSSFAGDFLSFQDVLSDEDAGAEAEAETSRAGGNNLKSSKEGSSRGQKRKASPHSGMSSERDALDEETPWCSSVDWQHRNITGLEQLNREVAAYYKFVQPSESEHQLRLQVVKRIASAISDRFKDATVHPFGSFNTRLYLPNGDIDLVVLSPSLERANVKSTLHKLAARLQKSHLLTDITVIPSAKVPIIKGVSTLGHFAVDISINQRGGLKAAPIVDAFMQQLGSHAARALIMVVKAFLMQRGLHEVYSGGLGSYSVICLVISFLQLHPRIQDGHIDPNQNLGVLLLEFFELYGCNFNYDVVGISLNGQGYYFDKVQRGWQQLERPFLLSIEDPQDTSNDISVGSRSILEVRRNFSGAYNVLKSALIARQSSLDARSLDRQVCTSSILVAIVGVPREAISARRKNMHLLDEDRSKPSPSKKAKREQSPSPPVTKEAPLTRAKVPAYALSDADRKEEGDMDVSLESVHTDSSPALPSRRSTPDVDPINLDRTESSPEAPESSKTASHRLAEIVKAEADELDLDSLNPPKQEEDEEESRYSITTKSSTPAKSKSIVPSLLPVKHEDDQDSEDESQVAHSLGAATSGSRSTSKRSREQSEEKPSIEKRPNANNKRAARQAYWAAKGVKQEDDENEL